VSVEGDSIHVKRRQPFSERNLLQDHRQIGLPAPLHLLHLFDLSKRLKGLAVALDVADVSLNQSRLELRRVQQEPYVHAIIDFINHELMLRQIGTCHV
jgi:hypothetical protein